jgi:hypothetical protein
MATLVMVGCRYKWLVEDSLETLPEQQTLEGIYFRKAIAHVDRKLSSWPFPTTQR